MEPMGNSAEAGTEIKIEIDYTYMYITDSGDYICKYSKCAHVDYICK